MPPSNRFGGGGAAGGKAAKWPLNSCQLAEDAPVGGSPSLGRIVRREDPDTGMSETSYTALDQIQTFTDGIDGIETPRETRFQYDGIGRLETMANEVDGTTMYSYDGLAAEGELGRLVETLSPNGHRERYRYEHAPADHDPLDHSARLSSIDRIIAGIGTPEESTFTTTLAYNESTGQLKTVSYPPPDGQAFNVHYGYDNAGNLTCVTDHELPGDCGPSQFWQWTEADQGHRLRRETFGNGVTTTYDYEDDTGRLSGISTLKDNLLLQSISYQDYDDNGNLTERVQQLRRPGGGGVEFVAETFEYDALDRLTGVDDVLSGDDEFFQYRDNGNLGLKSGTGVYSYAAPDGERFRPHAVQTIAQSASAGGNINIRYDDAGNVRERSGQRIQGGIQRFTHTAFNLPKTVTIGEGVGTTSIEYEYDAAQKRVVTRIGDGDADPNNDSLRIYAGGGYERETKGGVTRHLYKVMAAGRQVAQVERTDGVPDTRRYIHGDHLGSSQVMTDEDGEVVHAQRFDAWGEAIEPASESGDAATKNIRAGFTGHESDVETGLVNMRGRIYDPMIGRFLQADPIVQAPMFSQSWNRYSYVFNNPLNAIDPTGFECELGCEEEEEIEDPDDRTKDEGGTAPSSESASAALGAEVADASGSKTDAPRQHESASAAQWQAKIDATAKAGEMEYALVLYELGLMNGLAVSPPAQNTSGTAGSGATPSAGNGSRGAQAEPARASGAARSGHGAGRDGDGGGGTEAGDGEGAQASQSLLDKVGTFAGHVVGELVCGFMGCGAANAPTFDQPTQPALSEGQKIAKSAFAAGSFLAGGVLAGMIGKGTKGAGATGLIGGGVKAAEGSVPHVFWSGGPAAQKAAAEFAESIGGVTLEMTPIGMELTQSTASMAWSQAGPLWSSASQQFAASSSGVIHVFHGPVVSLQSTWAAVEFPILASNPAVTGFVFHVVP